MIVAPSVYQRLVLDLAKRLEVDVSVTYEKQVLSGIALQLLERRASEWLDRLFEDLARPEERALVVNSTYEQTNETSLHQLAEDASNGKVQTQLIFGNDPVFNAPADIPIGEALTQVPFTLTLADHANATSKRSSGSFTSHTC